ncbi:bifunctional homocysteine S-methyltransferase/methylenetetrahydrofolate reductase, partial [bacterium]
VGIKCGFTIACAYNPNAIDQAEEDDRLRRKADAGAQVIYTQPVFDLGAMEKSVAMAETVGIPVLVGLMPLKSSRHAEFMHNEVPGVRVPQDLRDRLGAAKDDAEGLEIGIASAIELRAEIAHAAHGLYLMPPFGNAAIAARVLGGPGLPREVETTR